MKTWFSNNWQFLLILIVVIFVFGSFLLIIGTDINSLEKPKTINDYTNSLQFPITFLNLIIITFLSYQVYVYNKNKDTIDFKSKTPLIVIRQIPFQGNYIIVNTGQGPALNVRILSNLDEENKTWLINQVGFDLANESEIELDYFNKEQYLILYSDMFGNEYFTYMRNNYMIFNSTNKKLANKYKSEYYKEALEKLNYKRAEEKFLDFHRPSV